MQKLLQTEMTRKQFIVFGGFAVASLFGVGGVIKMMTSNAATPFASLEAEDGVASNATVVTDSLASNGRAIKFGAGAAGRPASQAGSAAIGSARYPAPANAIWVSKNGNDANAGTSAAPYLTIKKAMSVAPAGATIVVRAGEYHEGGVYKAGNGAALAGNSFANAGVTLQNAPGEAVWFDGSVTASGWTFDGTNWRLPFVTQSDRTPTHTRGQSAATWPGGSGFINTAYPAAAHSEMLLMDGSQITQVDAISKLAPGKFFVEGSMLGGTGVDQNLFTSTAYVMRDNPTGHQMRISNLSRALQVAKQNITIRGIGIRRYSAALVDSATIFCSARDITQGFTMENVVVEDISNLGLYGMGNNSILRHCTFQRNGNCGVNGDNSDAALIEYCLFLENMNSRYNYGPAGGGSKVSYSHDQIWRYNRFETNYGHALWFDQSTYNNKIYSNDFINSYGHGIAYEISAKAFIADNLFVDIGLRSDLRAPYLSSAVWISGSDNVNVWSNTFVNCDVPIKIAQDERDPDEAGNNYGRDPRMPQSFYDTEMTWLVKKVNIKNNVFYRSQGTNSIQSAFIWMFANIKGTSTQQMGVSTGGNLYNRVVGGKPARFANGLGAGGIALGYFTMTGADHLGGPSWAAVTGETGSVFADGRDVMTAYAYPYSVKSAEASSVSLLGMDTETAAAVGRPAGTKQLGMWNT